MGPRTIQLESLAAKAGSVIANLASVLGLAFYVADRTSSLPIPSGPARLNIVLHLSILTAIAYGILWSIAERWFKWDFGAGGHGTLPSGWSAIVLSLSITIPLTVVPFLYQSATGSVVLLPAHWRGMPVVLLLGAIGHLIMYGIRPDAIGASVGIRRLIMPPDKQAQLATALLMELIYSAAYFSLIVFPYRVIVEGDALSLPHAILGRTVLPGLVFLSGMTVFILLKYPDSLNEPTWIQVRGVISGLIMMLCFCTGMYL